MRDASIVIGLGGIGADICAKVEAMIPANMPDEGRIRFVAIDTDSNCLFDLKKKGFRGTAIQISSNTSVGLCVERQKSEIDAWYPYNSMFDKKPMTEGAGQMRAISRLALHTAVKDGYLLPLYRIIDEMRQVSKEPSKQSIRFYVISSLSGGTGSGIFLPLAMYLEKYVKGLFGDFDSICKGFFILPSAMKDLTSVFLEKRSLDSNSYAAIKELNAFMEQEDGAGDKEYELFLELAKEGENIIVPYKSSGYEYCYLFGKVNTMKLLKDSPEEIKKAVANAVYMQVCSPIRGINNSREDNIPKFLTEQTQKLKEKKLRRFGAIGCGELVYPYKLLQSYYAMRWAIDTMSNHWRQYDKVYFEKEKDRIEQLKKRRRVKEVNRAEEYVNAVKLAERSDFFAEEIRDACTMEGSMIWDLYLDEVSKEIKLRIEQVKIERECDDIEGDGLFERILEHMQSNNIKKAEVRASIKEVLELFKKIRISIEEYVASNGKYLAEQMFSYYQGMEHKPYELAYWLNQEGHFIHPNGIRYFLYNLMTSVEKKNKTLQASVSEEKSIVDNVNQDDGEKGYKVLNKNKINKFYNDMKKAREALYKFSQAKLESACMDFLKDYVHSLIKSYEEFYDNYEDMLQNFGDEIDIIEQELEHQSGISSFYVCADLQCREMIFGRLKERREYMRASSELSAFIFQLLQEPLEREHVKRVFPSIKQYWIDSVEKEFEKIVNINILEAMKTEEECKTGHQLGIDGMKDLIEKSRGLLEAPMVRYITKEETKEISFCCYNNELESQKGIYKEVVEWLKNNQGVSDSDYCSRYQMIFYCSIVGIEMHDVLEFYHGRNNSLIEDGEAFLHYEETVDNIVLNDEGNPVLIPHIDQKWYSFLHLPDSHKKYQQKKEVIIAGMFLYARITHRLKKEENLESYHYINSKENTQKFKRLLHCHQYLYICPSLLQDLFKEFSKELDEDVKKCSSVDTCRLFKDLDENNPYDILIDYAKFLTEREFVPEKIEMLIYAVKWLIEIYIYSFEKYDEKNKVVDKIRELKEKMKSDFNQRQGMAKEMKELIDDLC